MNTEHLPKARPWAGSLLLLALALGGAATWASDQNPPELMTYQGYLVDANQAPLGSPSPKNYNVVFRIYDASQSGNELWAEQQTVTVDHGNFSVLLGEGSAVDANHGTLHSLFSGPTASDRFIGITVTGLAATDVEIAPRLRLMPSPYAFTARSALALVSNAGDTLLSAGNGLVGIKTVTPGADLDVNGTIAATNLTVTGPITATGLTLNGDASANNVNAGAVNAGSLTVADSAVALHVAAQSVRAANITADISLTANNGAVVKNTLVADSIATGLDINAGGAVTSAKGFTGYGVIPVGGIIMWSGAIPNIPDGWHLCDGTAGTPDLRNRFVIGAGNSYGVGAAGGSTSKQLSEGNLPPHTHGYLDGYWAEAFGGGIYNDTYYGFTFGGSHGNDYDNSAIWNRYMYTSDTPYAHATPFDIMPPYLALAYIMRVK